MTNLITVRIKFPNGAQTYDYAAPVNACIRVGQKVLVPATYGEKEVEVVEVLQSLSGKTTRGITGISMKLSADEDIKELIQRRKDAEKKVAEVLKTRAYAVAAEYDPILGKELRDLGLL